MGGGAHFCNQGAIKRVTRHRVLMNFMLNRGWHCQFLEEDCRTPLPLRLAFVHSDKIYELHERWGADRKLEDRSALEYAINNGRGSIWLDLMEEEYRNLCGKKSPTG
jgi:hypothetical protein